MNGSTFFKPKQTPFEPLGIKKDKPNTSMKRLKYAVILLLGLSIATTMMTSCKKDNAQSIVGTWENMYDVKIVSAYSGGSADWITIPAGKKFQFSENGLTTFPLGVAVSYEVSGNSLTLNDGTPIIIDELSNTTMKLSHNEFERQITLKKVNK